MNKNIDMISKLNHIHINDNINEILIFDNDYHINIVKNIINVLIIFNKLYDIDDIYIKEYIDDIYNISDINLYNINFNDIIKDYIIYLID